MVRISEYSEAIDLLRKVSPSIRIRLALEFGGDLLASEQNRMMLILLQLIADGHARYGGRLKF